MSVNNPQTWGLSGRGTFDFVSGMARDKILAEGYEMIEYTVPPEELDNWKAVALPFWDKWVADMEAAGYSEAQELLDTLLELVDTYRGVPAEDAF